MKVIVVGCGRFGIELADRLNKRGDEVVVLDESSDAFNGLPTDFNGRLVEGDAMNQDVLQRAGIDEADALVAVTNSDVLNLVVGHVAREVYSVPNVVARNYEVFTRDLYELFNLQVVSAATWGTQRMVELIDNSEARMVYSAGNGEITYYEINVPESWEGKTFPELFGDCGCQLTAVTRGGKAFIPEGGLVLECGDVLSVSATVRGTEVLRKLLSQSRKEA